MSPAEHKAYFVFWGLAGVGFCAYLYFLAHRFGGRR